MAEAYFLRVLAGYFGFPIILTVAFTLLLFWICRYFSNTALVQGPARNQPPAVPPRNLNLRTIATAALLFLLAPAWGLDSDCNAKQVKKQFKKLLDIIHTCNVSNDGLHEFRRGLCDPVLDKDNGLLDHENWNFETGLKIAFGFGFILVLLVLGIGYYRKKQQS